jgi:hypothetical protein
MRSSLFWDVTPCNPLKLSDVSEELAASIFRVVKQGTSVKQV